MISMLLQDVLLISCDGVRVAKGRMEAWDGTLYSLAVSIRIHRIQEGILGHIKRSTLVPFSREME